MAADDSYFQFPLCALACGESIGERLDLILDYGVVEAGAKLFRKLSAEAQRQFIGETRKSGQVPGDANLRNWRHCAALHGAHVIGLTYRAFSSVLERHSRLSNDIAEFEKCHGRDAQVRIKKAWVFDTRDHHGLTCREFAVLCAIYSVLGDKDLARITREQIRHRALGYKTAAVMQAELAKRADKASPLTVRQLRDTIERLHRNKFFARCTVARRLTYYSHRLDAENLRKRVLERRTYPAFFHASQAAQDQLLTAAIKKRNAGLAKGDPKPALPASRPAPAPPRAATDSSHRSFAPRPVPGQSASTPRPL